MITFIKEWANQIIVAVIIATIFEMILPNGNNKKYIKVIIGIYVLFTLIQPIVSKLSGKEITISTNYEKYFDEDILKTSEEDFENNNSKLIEEAYIQNIKNDVKTKLEKKGYKVISCSVDIEKDKENYGVIKNITLKIQSNEEEENKDNLIEIEKIEVNKEDNKAKEESNISDKQKQDIIGDLAEEYSIDKKSIIIN